MIRGLDGRRLGCAEGSAEGAGRLGRLLRTLLNAGGRASGLMVGDGTEIGSRDDRIANGLSWERLPNEGC